MMKCCIGCVSPGSLWLVKHMNIACALCSVSCVLVWYRMLFQVRWQLSSSEANNTGSQVWRPSVHCGGSLQSSVCQWWKVLCGYGSELPSTRLQVLIVFARLIYISSFCNLVTVFCSRNCCLPLYRDNYFCLLDSDANCKTWMTSSILCCWPQRTFHFTWIVISHHECRW